MYATLAVERRGGSVRRINWTVPQFSGGDDERTWVAARVGEAVDAVVAATGVAAPVVIGKSLKSLAASGAAGRGLLAVWLKPVLTDEPIVAALRRAAAPVRAASAARAGSCGHASSPGAGGPPG